MYKCHQCGKDFEMMADVWMMASQDGTVLLYFPVKGGKNFIIKAPVADENTPRFCSKKCLIDALIEMEVSKDGAALTPI